jgi:hypoxanthine phosphoribosyltransferase
MNTEPGARILISRKRIAAAVKRLAGEIRQDYYNKNPLFIGVLKGSFIFLSDLIRYLDFPLEIDFIRLGSYGNSTRSSGCVTLLAEPCTAVSGRHILIVEDIVDTGLTVDFLREYLQRHGAASIKICSLADKPSRREVPVEIDYLGFTVPDKFLVGYGLDRCEKYRNIPDICVIETS